MQKIILAAVMGLMCVGCASNNNGNSGILQSYAAPRIEAAWIRNGEPIIHDGQQWFAARDVEVLTDNEVYQIGEYRDVQIFVDKLDIKPYQRIYTKFANGQFRYYERISDD